MSRERGEFATTLNEGNTYRSRRHSPGAQKAKIAIRETVLSAIGAGEARVFDAFAGAGEMYRGVWRRAAAYVGCDKEWFQDDRLCFVADNVRVMRCIDLCEFDVFDFDAYGSPWETLHVLAARRGVKPGERIGVVITDGSGLRLKMGWIPDALALMSGLRRHMPGVARNHEMIIDMAIAGLCRRMKCRVLSQERARGKSSGSLWYVGLVLRGEGDDVAVGSIDPAPLRRRKAADNAVP